MEMLRALVPFALLALFIATWFIIRR